MCSFFCPQGHTLQTVSSFEGRQGPCWHLIWVSNDLLTSSEPLINSENKLNQQGVYKLTTVNRTFPNLCSGYLQILRAKAATPHSPLAVVYFVSFSFHTRFSKTPWTSSSSPPTDSSTQFISPPSSIVLKYSCSHYQ